MKPSGAAGMSKEAQHRTTKGSFTIPLVAAAIVVAICLAAGGVVLAARHSGGRTRAHLTDASGHSGHTRKHLPPARLAVVSVTPRDGGAGVAWNAAVTVHFSTRLSSRTVFPVISPPVTGSWGWTNSTTLSFRPVGNFVPYAKETVSVPADTTSAQGVMLGHVVQSHFTVAGASTLRLQELLAELGYLPVAFTPAGGAAPAPVSGVPTKHVPGYGAIPAAPGPTGTTVVAAPAAPTPGDIEPSVASDVPLRPISGTFTWRFSHIPPSLASLWQSGQYTVVTRGAVMAFESAHGLDDDGVAGPLVWKTLLHAVAAHQLDTAPYDYVYVSEGSPEYVTIWRDGVDVFTTLANTGIPQAPTAAGTWPVYARYLTTTMSGTEPDGQTYSDPGIPYVSYFNGGDALHGFLRAQYGFPQSLGCVEMPYSSAQTVWPYTPIGTLVTVA